MEVYDALARARAAGRRVVLVTVVAVEGSAPSHTGAKLVVGDDGVIAGTLGCSEFDTAGTQLAAEALQHTQPLRKVVGTPDDDDPRSVELFAEVHEPEPAVIVLGSNPVGRAVVAQARAVGRRAVLVSRGGDTDVAAGVEVKADDPERYLLAAPPGEHDAVVVSDHDAPWVDAALRVALASDAGYVGMLGSRRHAPAAVARLRTLRGVGRWTAEYALLRGLGRLHVFPGDDIGARNNLQRWLGLLEPLDYEGVQRVLARWQPFQGLVYLHLLLWGLRSEHAKPATRVPRLGTSVLR